MANRTLLFFILFLAVTLTITAQDLPPSKGAASCSKKKSAMQRVPVLKDMLAGGIPHAFDVLKYTLDLRLYPCYFSPYPKNFTASVVVRFKADSTLNAITLNATGSSLIIDSVRLAGTSYTHADNILTINLKQTFSSGEIGEVKIYYRHLNVSDGAFYASDGMVFTDCEPEGARKWFPCWDSPADKALLDLTARVPANVKFGSNGKLTDSTLVADTLVYQWASIHNIATYLVVMSSKINYNLDIVYWHKPSNPADSVPIRFYYNNGENISSARAVIGPMTTWYSDHFCEYPFQKNGFAALNNQFPWGGMENQTLTSICPNCWVEWLLAHENAHQWFGDMITCATWADIWLNEGFATWSENFWWENSGGYAAYKSNINNDAAYYLANNPGWAISVPSWATATPSPGVLFNYSISYAKGACVLHMLRYSLGDSLFFATLQAYSADTSLQFKSATIADFNAITNSVTGQDYNWFFSQWIFSTNHPVYQNKYFFDQPGNGNWDVHFLAKQVQANASFFKMPVIVKIHFQDNSDTLIRVMNNKNNQEYLWTFSKQPVSVVFDPGNEIVLKQATLTQGIFYTKLWTGSISDDWNVAGNWNPAGVPVDESVNIPAGAFRMPVIRDEGMSCGVLHIEAGAGLTILPTKSILTHGNLILE